MEPTRRDSCSSGRYFPSNDPGMVSKAMLISNSVKYAPFGGCYDDWVVTITAAEILKQGFVVGTFNFRYPPKAA